MERNDSRTSVETWLSWEVGTRRGEEGEGEEEGEELRHRMEEEEEGERLPQRMTEERGEEGVGGRSLFVRFLEEGGRLLVQGEVVGHLRKVEVGEGLTMMGVRFQA